VSFELPCPVRNEYDPDFIVGGGVGPDQIRSLDDPPFIRADRVDFLRPDDRVIGVEMNGEARAYPKKILNAHEIVNQCFGDVQTVLTYCPLTNSGIHYATEWTCGVSRAQRYAVSGMLYLINYDFNSYADFWSDSSEPWFFNEAMRRRMNDALGYKEDVLGVIGPSGTAAVWVRPAFSAINVEVGGVPVVVFKDSGTDDAFAFERAAAGRTLTFEPAATAIISLSSGISKRDRPGPSTA